MTPRQKLIINLGAAAAIAACGIVIFELGRQPEAIARIQSPPQIPVQELSIALVRVGLDAKNLTAAGVSVNSIDGVVDNVRTQLATSGAQLASADESCVSLRAQVEALERTIQSGQGQQEDVSALASARSGLASAESSQQSALNAIHNAGVANLSEIQRAVLADILANKAWELPTEFLTVTRTQEQWVQLRNALANERIAAAMDQEPAVEAQALLAQVRSDNTVAAASANLIANLTASTAAWNQSLTP